MPDFPDSEIYRNILESLPTGLCVIDLGKKIVLWSDGAERITGHLRHEVIGRLCDDEMLLHCDQQDCCSEESPVLRTIKTSQPAEAVGFIHHKDGHEIVVRTSAVPVRNQHGSIIGAVEVFEERQVKADPDHREDRKNLPGCVDELTSVASYTMMRAHLREALGTYVELQVPFGVLLLRLEGLEQFRVSNGSDAAANLLRMVARTLESTLWRSDFVGRWNEEHFLVILNGCDDDATHTVRTRAQRMLNNEGIEWWGERRSLPAVIGEAAAQPGDSLESLMERAKTSMGQALHRTPAAAGGQQSS